MDDLNEKATELMNIFHKFCTAQGWDVYSVVYTGDDANFDCLSDAGNGFIRQCTSRSCSSSGRQMICRPLLPGSDDIDQVSVVEVRKPR